jgi:hypothetical protein
LIGELWCPEFCTTKWSSFSDIAHGVRKFGTTLSWIFGKLEAGELPNTPKSGGDDALFIAKNWQQHFMLIILH